MKIIKSYDNLDILVDDDDFDYLNQYKWSVSKRGKYARTNIKKDSKYHTVRIHRLIMNVTDSSIQVDHIDGNPLNNQKSNLRICSWNENAKNRRQNSSSKTNYKGVSCDKRHPTPLWYANISVNKRRIWLGTFYTEIDAAKAYNAAALKYHGPFAKLNIIKEK